MKRIENDEDLKTLLQSHAPLPPPAARGQLDQILRRVRPEKNPSTEPRLSWLFGGAMAASMVGIAAFWMGTTTQELLLKNEPQPAETEIVWELLADPEMIDLSAETEIGEEYLQLVL